MSALDTALCDTLTIDRPIVQAPIGAAPELVAAVSEVGGLGTLSVTWTDPEETRANVRAVRERTAHPFAVNIVLDPDAKDVPTDDALDAALDAGAKIVSFSFGDATPYVDRVHDAGGTVLQTVGSADEAAAAERVGVDVVVAQGWEAGGHVQSETATMPLVPQVADAVDVPVVAAGGIADGRGIAAALALGADGVWLGTRFVATREAAKHPEYKEHVLEATGSETEFTELFDVGWPGVPHRVVRTETVERWENAGRPPTGERPGEGEVIAERGGEEIQRYDFRSPSADTEGEIDAMALYAGQSAGGIDELPSTGTVVERLAEETTERIDALTEQ